MVLRHRTPFFPLPAEQLQAGEERSLHKKMIALEGVHNHKSRQPREASAPALVASPAPALGRDHNRVSD